MDWQDGGIVLSLRKHGESSVVVHLLTREHGRHSGLVRGGNSKKQRGVLQPGNEVHANFLCLYKLKAMTGSEISESHEGIFLSALFEPLQNKVAETFFKYASA